MYYTLIKKEEVVVILLGGFKNAQEKNIKKARQILKREIFETGRIKALSSFLPLSDFFTVCYQGLGRS